MKDLIGIKNRIIGSDLIPSRLILLDGIDGIFNILEASNYNTPERLRKVLKSKKLFKVLQEETGIPEEYLKQLKREIESYYPKKIKLTEFTFVNKAVVEQCIDDGFTDSLSFYNYFKDKIIDDSVLNRLFNQVQLTRIQWVSPMAAEMFISAGYDTPEIIRNADAEQFCSDVMRINQSQKFFNGNIGLRDMKRVIYSAGFFE